MLVVAILVSAFYLTTQRFKARQYYMQLSQLQNNATTLNKEFTRLQLEEGTYSSELAVQDYATHSLGLVPADKKHVREFK